MWLLTLVVGSGCIYWDWQITMNKFRMKSRIANAGMVIGLFFAFQTAIALAVLSAYGKHPLW